MFFHRPEKVKDYDRSKWKPVIRVSICTGEMTACFQSVSGHELREVMAVHDEKDVEEFRGEYGIREEIERVY